ncbi:S-layer homology domain-containing protein [Tepidibacter formicigenes]|jgi:hypothetical protein|uniref:S-layer homology domain-containing protein n=1 Tax=Tepidibacter formicigenes DSM 15518 TaxID=1123349 RepID=A0A1M6U5S0_9FIRM|nr:S-layer homology domain-containing protein [Tepidibacter formicigenes]SHK64537.1 S-layer homology domain-containing protein [Tepidibacter formicigenes DSM 15518]
MKKRTSLFLIFIILFCLGSPIFADSEENNSSLKSYLETLVDVLYKEKEQNSSNYEDIDSILREYLKNDEGISSLSEDAEKIILIMDLESKDKLLNILKENNNSLENVKKEILNLKMWNESDRYSLLDMIKEGEDRKTIKLELENLINKYNNTDNNNPNNDNKINLKDINNHWAKDYILFMVENKIATGYLDFTFRPNNKITRAEFSKMLVETLKLDKVTYNNSFSDVKNHWAKDYIQTAYNAGLIKGYNKEFKPDANITRSEMATMIGRTLNTDNKADLTKFIDYKKIPNWAEESVSKAVGEELIKGDNGKFRPNDNTTRAEAITILYRLLNID